MAGGFGGIAKDAMAATLSEKEDRRNASMDFDAEKFGGKKDSIEVSALDEEQGKEVLEVLQERHIASKPMKSTGKFIKGIVEGGGDEDKTPKRKKKQDDKSPAMQFLQNVMPFFTWIRLIDGQALRGDIVAGITVGVMVIPQSMSYGAIAGLPYINGMYSACVPAFIYAFFGQSRQLAVGPVAMVSLLVEAGLRGALTEEECPEWYALGGENSPKAQYELCPEPYVQLAVLTAFVVGLFQIIGSVLKIGVLVSFLGHPVISGFTSAAAIIIGLSQLKDLLGYPLPKSQFIYVTVWNILKDIGKLKPAPLLLGLLFLAYLIGNKKMAQKHARLKMMAPAGPLISCVVGSLLVWAIPNLYEDHYVKTVGEIPSGLMPISVGSWDLGKLGAVLPTAMSSTLIGYMESIAIGKNLAAKHGYEIEAGQEMLALGLSNFVGSAFSCYPVTGSFSRSAVNNNTGCKTQLSGLITSIVMLCTLLFLTPLFYYLPKFVLAVIVMSSVLQLIAIEEAKHLYHVKRHDFLLWVVAFIGTLFLGVLMGICVAVGLSLVIVIYESVRPQITILWRIPGTTIYRNVKQESSGAFIPNVFICRIGNSLYFANVSYVKEMLLAYVEDLKEVNPVEYIVLEMTPVITVDSTACHELESIVKEFRDRGIEVAFAMVGNRVDKTFRKAGLKEVIKERWFFQNVHSAVEYCLRHQHARNNSDKFPVKPEQSALDLTAIDVGVGDEIGFSNEMDHENTMAFITLAMDIPMIMSEIANVFKKLEISIIRCQIEPLPDDGAKHTYFLKSIKTGKKLTEQELDHLRDDLAELMRTCRSRPRGSKDNNGISAQALGKGFEEASPASTAAMTPSERLTATERELQALKEEMKKDSKKGCGDGVSVKLCGLIR